MAKCRSCGLLQQNPRPDFADIVRYYPQEYQAFQSQNDSIIGRIHYYTKTIPFMRFIESLVPKDARIVEIGCGNGERLRILQQAGFSNVYGIEPSEVGIQAVHQHNIKHGVLEAGDLPDGSVDLVLMVHVLEHLPDPRSTLSLIQKALRPDGYFCGEIPVINCLEQKIFGRYWVYYHLPRHLTFFSAMHLQQLLTTCGFTRITGQYIDAPTNWVGSLLNLLYARKQRAWRQIVCRSRTTLAILSFPVAKVLRWCGQAPNLRFVCQNSVHESRRTPDGSVDSPTA